MKLYISTLLLLLLTFFGCKKDSKDALNNYAYFGGEIINPNTDYVILLKSEAVIDTIKLDSKNRFLYKIKNLDEGIYSFYHGGEIQMILLEPNDSIIFRLNTLEFDESLVFTGEGAKKNNYLIDEYLENERSEKKIYKFCQLSPKAYENQLDSIKEAKLKKLKTFKSKYDTSDLFEKIATANIDFSYYSSKEVYPFVHYGENKTDILKSLPKDFYSYRDDIDYNNMFFKDYYNYKTFLRYSINNIALKNHLKHDNKEPFKWSSLCYNLDRLNLVDSLVKNESIKDYLLSHFTMYYLSKNKNLDNNLVLLNSFLSKSKNKDDKNMLVRFNQSLTNLKNGGSIPEVKILDYQNTEHSITSLINSPTVLSFWSHAYLDHFKDSHNKIIELKMKYPEVRFVMINIDNNDMKQAKESLFDNRFSVTDEYLFKNPAESKDIFAIYPMTKSILIDKNQKIVNSNSNIFSVGFEQEVLGLINK